MGRMWACPGMALGASTSPEPPPPSWCCAGLGPRSSGECQTLQPTSPWTPAMLTRCAWGPVSGWTGPRWTQIDCSTPTSAAQVQGLCGTFTRNQQDDFLTPAGDVETSIAAFASKFQVGDEGRCPSEDSTLLSPCSTHAQHHIFSEAACAVLRGPAFQVAGLRALLLFTPVRWGRTCPALLLGNWEALLPAVAVGTRGSRRTHGGGTDPFPPFPSRSATAWWTGSHSICAAWQPCVAVPLAGTASVLCWLPMLAAVPRRVPHFSGGTKPSAVSLLSWPAPPQGSCSQPLLGVA